MSPLLDWSHMLHLRNCRKNTDRQQKLLQTCLSLVILFALFAALISPAQAAAVIWPTTPSAANSSGRWPTVAEIQCGAYIVMDRNSGKVFLEKLPDQPLYPASTTKVLTSLIALEQLNLNEVITVSATAIQMPAGSSKIGYRAGEQVVVRDMLAGLMLASGNDAANALAERIDGTVELFAARMNERARKAGAIKSNFMSPSGTHHELHVTTARDLALITIEALKNPFFRELVALKNCSLPATNLHPYNGWSVLINTNRLMVFDDSYFASDELKDITGVKTGSTNMAGNNLVASATTSTGVELVAVILKMPLNTNDTNPSVYMRTLLEEGARRARGQMSPTPSGAVAATTGSSSSQATTQATGQTSAQSTLSGQVTAQTTVTTNGSNVVTESTKISGSESIVKPSEAGFLETISFRFGIDQATLLLIAVLCGVLVGILFGLTILLTVFRATRGRNSRRNSQINVRPVKRR
jgi:D-alanyl-D-alanine carboxypeptidase